jgi:hypothetical protein
LYSGLRRKPKPSGQDLQHAFAVHQAVLADAGAEDLEDQVLLLEPDVVLDVLRRAISCRPMMSICWRSLM